MIVISAKPEPVVSIIVDPLTGDTKMALNPKFKQLYGPVYPGIIRQELEKALEIIKMYENSASM